MILILFFTIKEVIYLTYFLMIYRIKIKMNILKNLVRFFLKKKIFMEILIFKYQVFKKILYLQKIK